MREETTETRNKLRSGYTTGACATVTSLAAAILLLKQQTSKTLSITLPKGQHVEFQLEVCEQLNEIEAQASTIKDAGDDPDVTHQATVHSRVKLAKQAGVNFFAAQGVGMVTRDGLPIPKGEPAINPVPRKMITEHLSALANDCHYRGGFDVYIGVLNGEALAKKTMNPRLGILRGLSILGTTGIVRPFSCSAYIASIHQGIDVAHANGIQHIAACTGSSSEDYIKTELDLPELALIEMGDFIGAVLKHLRKVPMQRLTICGGFGKISKLAAGHKDLHSRVSSIDLEFLASQAAKMGADGSIQKKIIKANTSIEALNLYPPLGNQICQLAKAVAEKVVPETCVVDVVAINKQTECVGHAWYFNGSGQL
ncbi:cobalt-precorrin-5B (C(1))-methyltransferase [Beggiatoa alba]|nr:cobalt-precorrin-5B (C(1))-methyltransferase [Beggiatoa alba]